MKKKICQIESWATASAILEWPHCEKVADCVVVTGLGVFDVCNECVIFIEELDIDIDLEHLVREVGLI